MERAGRGRALYLGGGVAGVHVESGDLGLGDVADLLEGGHESCAEERVPVALGVPPLDDAEAVVGGTGGVREESLWLAVVTVPAEFLADGVVLADRSARELQELTDCHELTRLPSALACCDRSP